MTEKDRTREGRDEVEANELLAAIVAGSVDAIYSKNLDRLITSWNAAAEALYGYSADEAIGQPVGIVIPPERRGEEQEILAHVVSGQRINHYETTRVRKDGRRIDVSLSISPIHDRSGSITGASVIARDIAELKRMQAGLQEQADMLDLVEDAVIARDLAGCITYWNQTAGAIYGWTKEEALGATSHELLRSTFPKPREEIEAELAARGRWEGEIAHRRKDGSKVTVASRWSLRRDEDGSPLEILEVNNDITAQKAGEEAIHAAKDEAERANQAKSDFLSRMSHELRTPLHSILGFGQLLEMEELTAEQRETTEDIIKAGRRLLELINEVLDIARVESGALALSLEPLLICDLIEECVGLIRPLAAERGIKVRSECADRHQHVRADRHRLGQVLLNLLSNGIKYNVAEGTVTVTCTRTDGGLVRVGVTDTGPGIPAEKLPLLFTPFERLGAEQSAIEGTGLGLALSKSLVEAMGGRIAVETMGGRGTTFWVELQAAEAPHLEPLEETPEERPAPTGQRARILYVEDNLANLKLMQRLFRHRRPLQLIPALSGALGLDLARQHLPDLILLDLGLPDIKGHDVLMRLRKDPKTAHIPVVVLSADATPGEIERLLAAGAADYLTKPIDVSVFMRVLDDLLGREERRSGASSDPHAPAEAPLEE